MEQHLQKSDAHCAKNTKAIAEKTKERNEQFCILSDKIAEESKERHRQFYELLLDG